MKKIVSILTICALIMIGGYAVYDSQKKHIGGNILNLAYGDSPRTSHLPLPWKNNTIVSGLLYRTLFLPDHTLLNFTPDLASYSVEDDGMKFIINFKEGNVWSDGKPITLQDVVWSIEASQVEKNANNLYKAAFSMIDSMEIKGNVLTINMKEKTNMLLPMLAQLAILPHHILGDFDPATISNIPEYWKAPLSSGLYRFNKVHNREYISLVRNEKYSGKKANIEEVRLHLDSNKALIDYYSTSNIAEMVNYRSMRDYTEFTINMYFYRYFVYNIEGDDGHVNPAMQDINVRQAIAMAIDRRKILRDVYIGAGDIVNGAGVVGSLGPYNYNPTKAKELLEKSDYDLNRPLRIAYYYTDSTSLLCLKQIQTYLEAIGFKVELVKAPDSTFLYEERNYDVLLKGLASFQPSEWYEEYASTHSFLTALNGGKGELDELIIELAGETDRKKQDILMTKLTSQENGLLYKFPLFSLGQSAYINTSRIELPKDFKHGNFIYKFDMKLDEWKIKKR